MKRKKRNVILCDTNIRKNRLFSLFFKVATVAFDINGNGKKMWTGTPSCSGEANPVGLVTLVQYILLWSAIYEKNSLYFFRKNLGWTRNEEITCKGWEIHINKNVLISIWETRRDFSCTVEGTTLRRFLCQRWTLTLFWKKSGIPNDGWKRSQSFWQIKRKLFFNLSYCLSHNYLNFL